MPHSSQPWCRTQLTLSGAIALRPTAPTDQAFLDHLYATSRGDLQQFPGDAAFIAQLIGMQQRMQTAGFQQNFPRAQHYVVQQHGQAVGRLIIDVGDMDIRLVDLVLLPETQGRGIGTKLLQALQDLALQQGLAISLAVSLSNAPAKRLYGNMGFTVVASDGLFEQMRWFAHPAACTTEVQHAA